MADLGIRPAVAADLPAIVAMLADDALGQAREDSSLPLDARYRHAFEAIGVNPDQYLMVAVLDSSRDSYRARALIFVGCGLLARIGLHQTQIGTQHGFQANVLADQAPQKILLVADHAVQIQNPGHGLLLPAECRFSKD